MGILVKVYVVIKLCFASFAISAFYAVLLVYEFEKMLRLDEFVGYIVRAVLFVFLLVLSFRYLFFELILKVLQRPFLIRKTPWLVVCCFSFMSSVFCAEVAIQIYDLVVGESPKVSSFYRGIVGVSGFVIAYIFLHKRSMKSV